MEGVSVADANGAPHAAEGADPGRHLHGPQLQRRQSDSGPGSPRDAALRKRHSSSDAYDNRRGDRRYGDDDVDDDVDDGGADSTSVAAAAAAHQQRYQCHSDTPAIFTVTEGKHARLSCRVTGKPKPDIVWKKGGVELPRGRRHMMYEDDDSGGGGAGGAGGGGLFVLRVLFCRQEDNGSYTCSASNAVGQTFSAVQLVVNEPQEQFKSRLRDVEVRERGVATLECEVPSAGVAARWFLEETPLAPGSKYGMEADGTTRRLVIRDVTADDDAVYVCETRAGSRTVAELSVTGRIVQKLPRLVEVREGDAVTLSVEVDDPLARGEWLRDGASVAAATRGGAMTARARGRTRSLAVAGLRRGDDCLVAFRVGESKTTCRVRVKVPAPRWSPCDFRVRAVTRCSVTLAWRAPPGAAEPAGYALETRESGGDRGARHAWRDVGGDAGARGEITVGGLQTGARYEFRVAAVAAAGDGARGPFAELPRPVLVKADLEVHSPLSDVHAAPNDDATFTVELSRPAPGQWLRNGRRVSSAAAASPSGGRGPSADDIDDERHVVGHFGATHTLVVRRVGWHDDGAAIAFLAESGALRADATLRVAEGAGFFSRLLSVSFAFAVVAYLLAYLLGIGGGGGGPAGLLEGTPVNRLT